jgi:hypothetical protein
MREEVEAMNLKLAELAMLDVIWLGSEWLVGGTAVDVCLVSVGNRELS